MRGWGPILYQLNIFNLGFLQICIPVINALYIDQPNLKIVKAEFKYFNQFCGSGTAFYSLGFSGFGRK
jgi:hypothetical protein